MTVAMAELMNDYLGYPLRQMLTVFGVRNRMLEYREKIRDTFRRLMEQRLAETSEAAETRPPDMLDTILSLDDHPAETLISLASEFRVGGSHSTNQMLAWAMYEVCCNARVSVAIQSELETQMGNRPFSEPISVDDMEKMTYFGNVWRETCRLHPLGPFFNRITTKDLKLCGSGVHLPAGTNLLAYYRGCHMAHETWKDPDEFRPERWDDGVRPSSRIYTFGMRPRACPGRFLADYEGPLILAELFRRFQFKLACEPGEIVGETAFVDSPRCTSKKFKDGMGVPVYVS